MKVKEIMVKKVIAVGPSTKITEVAKILFENKFHAVPVVEEGKVVGIVTENDFFTRDTQNVFLPSLIGFIKGSKITEKLAEEEQEKVDRLVNMEARDIMTKKCVSILGDMDVNDLLGFFRETKFNSLPVIDGDDKLIGIITLIDIIGLIKAK